MVKITGGTGFIGSHIVDYFMAHGVEIKSITRDIADLRDLCALKKAFENADCVIHNAAKVTDWGNYRDFYDNNVSGTVNVIEACLADGIKYIIITTSCSVYGEDNYDGAKDENWPMNSHYPYFLHRIFPSAMNFYRDTKRMAKEAALRYTDRLDICFIEPVWVYGEREFHTGFYEYLKAVKAGVPFSCGSKRNKFHTIYVKDLAKAYYLAYKEKKVGSYLIAPPEAENMDNIYRLLCEAAGFKKPRNLPKSICYPLGLIAEFLWTVLRAKNPPLLSRGRVNMFYDNIEYKSKKAREELGFFCEYSLCEGIERTVNWYKKEGFL